MQSDQNYNVKSDCCQKLYNDNEKTQLISYGFVGYYGMCGVGKTYQMNQTAKQYIEQSKKSVYNLKEPTLNNGNITHNFYISPSIKNDMTMRDSQDEAIYIVANNENITMLVNLITQMAADMSLLLELQYQLLYGNFSKEKQLMIIQRIETMKKSNSKLKVQTEEGRQVYERLGQPYDGFMLRRQKILLRFDDFQGSKITNTVRNQFCQLLINRRHLGIWFCGVVFHSFSNATDSLRTLQNYTILFQGVDYEVVKTLFGQLPKLQTDNFTENDFLNLYKNMAKVNQFNFMVIGQQPDTYLGISWGENQVK